MGRTDESAWLAIRFEEHRTRLRAWRGRESFEGRVDVLLSTSSEEARWQCHPPHCGSTGVRRWPGCSKRSHRVEWREGGHIVSLPRVIEVTP